MFKFKDVFISYGRRESLGFVGRLHQQLKLKGYECWFDKVNIPDGDDFSLRINHGIESAHNFVYVMATRSLSSPYCLIELEYARVLGKRVIPINQMVVFEVENQPLSSSEKSALERFYYEHRLSDPNLKTTQEVLQRSLKLIGTTDWLDAKEELSLEDCTKLINWAKSYENHWHKHEQTAFLQETKLPVFGKSIDTLESAVERVIAVLKREQSYVTKHTEILANALHWSNNQQLRAYLLVGHDRQATEAWLLQPFTGERQAPCQPSSLHCEFICESRKNAENLMVDVFVCYSTEDAGIRDKVIKTLSRHGVTTWNQDQDIRKGENYQQAIIRGIIEADNFMFFVSPHSVNSPHCQQEYQQALKLNKRVIPLLVAETPTNLGGFEKLQDLANMQYIDFTDNVKHEDYGRDLDEILNLLKQDSQYFEEHKQLLAKALKWKQYKEKPVFLLRGFNLENAQTWLRVNRERGQYAPTNLHREFILASEAAKGNLSTEVFISYSRKDSDFARQLNNALQEIGKTTWFDQESIASGADFQAEIYKGIVSSDNFLFIISPDAVASPYCKDEVEFAASQNKRMINVLHRSSLTTSLPKELADIHWLDFENKEFGEEFTALVQTIEIDRDHAHQHTILQQRATEWEENNKGNDFLLNTPAHANAERWLKKAKDKTPAPTALQEEYIQKSGEAIAIVEASERATAKRLKLRLQYARVALAAAVLLLFVAGYFIWQSNENLKIVNNKTKEVEKALKENKANSIFTLVQTQNITEKNPTLAFNLLTWASKQFQNTDEVIKEVLYETYRRNSFYKSFKCWKGWYHIGSINSVCFSLDGSTLLTGGGDHTAKLWDHLGNELQTFIGHSGSVTSVSFSLNGNEVLTGSDDGTAKLWNLSGKELQTFIGHTQGITSVIFSPDGSKVLTGSKDHTARLWDLSGNELQTFIGHTGGVTSVVFSNDGSKVLTGSDDGNVILWDYFGNELQSFIGRTGGITSVVFSPDGKQVLTGSRGNTAKLWDLTGFERKTFKGHKSAISSVNFSLTGKQVLTGSDDNTAKLWDLLGNELQTFKGHTDGVTSVVFSPDGKQVLTGSKDHTAKIWNISGNELQFFNGHTRGVTSVNFSPDGRQVLTGSHDLTAKLWDLKGNELQNFKGHKNTVSSVIFSPDGRQVLTGSHDRTAKLWDLKGNELQNFIGHRREVSSVIFSPDGRQVLTGSHDRTAKLWDLTGNELQTFKGHTGSVISVFLSPDGSKVLTGSKDKTARLWDLSGNELQTFKGHKGTVSSVKFSPDGSKILTGSDDGTAKLWDYFGNELQTFKGHKSAVYSVVFSPDGRQLLTGSKDHTARLWDLLGNELQTFNGHTSAVSSVNFSSDGSQVLTGSSDYTAKLWRFSGKKLQTFNGHSYIVSSVTFSPAGDKILTGSDDGSAKLWDYFGNEIISFKGHTSVTSVAFSPDGNKILTGSRDNTAKLWDLKGNEIISFNGHTSSVTSVAFSPDGNKILTGSRDNTAKLWDLKGNEIISFKGYTSSVTSVAFSPDGNKILTGSRDNTAKLWDLKGNEIISFNGHTSSVTSVAFSPDGNKILTGSKDNTAKLWNLSGNGLKVFKGHTEGVTSVNFSPDGRQVLTGSHDLTAKLWDLKGNELQTYIGHSYPVSSVSISPDGKQILTGSWDKTAKLWDLKMILEDYIENGDYDRLTEAQMREYGLLMEY